MAKIVAVMSDRSKFRLGRRRSFLAISVLPFAALSFLVFTPPFGSGAGANLAANSVWVFVTITLLYWFMTMYVTPFFAWLSELGHDSNERLFLSTLISITWALGFMVGSQSIAFQGIFEKSGMEPRVAFQTVTAIFAAVSFVCMMLPIIFIDEKRYCRSVPSDEGFFSSIGRVIKDRNFLRFTLSDFSYWVALTFISSGLVYFVTTLLKLPKEFYSTLILIMFLLSFVFYVPVNFLARAFGKRRLLMTAFVVFGLTFLFTAFLGKWPFSPYVQGYIVVVLAAVPLAIFGILPNAMVSDMAEAYAR